MKQILLSILMLVCVMGIKAQDLMVATLQSGDATQVFYGANAFVDAVGKANSGDLITLSAGTFNVPRIEKALRIQGSGYMDDPENGLYRTTLNYELYINLPEGSSDDFLLEGIYSDKELRVESSTPVKNFILKRCRFYRVSFSGATTENCQLEHCRISDYLIIGDKSTNFSVINSVINALRSNNENSSIVFQNTFVNDVSYDAIVTFENCILSSRYAEDYSNVRLHQNCIIKHCLALKGNMFANVWDLQNYWYSDKTTIWGADKGYSDTDLYELTDDAKKQYTDAEGKEIGIHGGHKPFSSTPSHPQIIKRDIATKTSGGKLKVDITVEAQDD
ncbi:hypothetical protein [Parabacteroides johnsonii]|uniref:hypothetical protein n=1 Tax=Parabacteroides johnsonii TaxID=387661 RepID=UPI00242AF52A|nr:hypothetical protein [Parabacteroides johnsonii]